MPEAHSAAAVHTAPIARLDAVATPVDIGGDGDGGDEYRYGRGGGGGEDEYRYGGGGGGYRYAASGGGAVPHK